MPPWPYGAVWTSPRSVGVFICPSISSPTTMVASSAPALLSSLNDPSLRNGLASSFAAPSIRPRSPGPPSAWLGIRIAWNAPSVAAGPWWHVMHPARRKSTSPSRSSGVSASVFPATYASSRLAGAGIVRSNAAMLFATFTNTRVTASRSAAVIPS